MIFTVKVARITYAQLDSIFVEITVILNLTVLMSVLRQKLL